MDVGEADLMESDGMTPSWGGIESFLGLFFYYQHFIPDRSAKSKPLFILLSGRQEQRKTMRGMKSKERLSARPVLIASNWTTVCKELFQTLKN